MADTNQSISASIQVVKGVATPGYFTEGVELIACDKENLLLVFPAFADTKYLLLVTVDHDASSTIQFTGQANRNTNYVGLKFSGCDENTNANISVLLMGNKPATP